MYLRCAVHDTPKQGRKWLPVAEFWYKSTLHSSLKCSPFKVLYGIDPNLGGLPHFDSAMPADAPTGELYWGAHTDRLHAQLARAQASFKKQTDLHRAVRAFDVGEQVLLKLQPYDQSSIVNRPCRNLSYKFYGPFMVAERNGTLAYRLQLPADCRIHPVFHVSQLKPVIPDYTPVFSELPRVLELVTGEAEPMAILERCMMKEGDMPIIQLQV
ncbi:uncharacterized protein [Aegilops tauschii subsp. strangulata]|uniref:uncharacterized protein n=1 Tax=Aegilops tauschii subsp. strangulata TaxID=200361 RepID=UPI00098BC0A2|nr:uncharacterized protein LOC109732273 [Aegilops tauschii subsp. strangulata]